MLFTFVFFEDRNFFLFLLINALLSFELFLFLNLRVQNFRLMIVIVDLTDFVSLFLNCFLWFLLIFFEFFISFLYVFKCIQMLLTLLDFLVSFYIVTLYQNLFGLLIFVEYIFMSDYLNFLGILLINEWLLIMFLHF